MSVTGDVFCRKASYIEKTKHPEMLGRLLKALSQSAEAIFFSQQLDYSIVAILIQALNIVGRRNATCISCVQVLQQKMDLKSMLGIMEKELSVFG